MSYDMRKMQDIKFSEKDLYNQYLEIWNNTNLDEILPNVATFLNDNPSFKYKIFNAYNWNRLINKINDGTDDCLVGEWNKDYSALETASTDFKYLGLWEAGKSYKKNNLVKTDDYNSYFCIQDNTSSADNQPPNTTYWLPAKILYGGIIGIPITSTIPTGIANGDIILKIM